MPAPSPPSSRNSNGVELRRRLKALEDEMRDFRSGVMGAPGFPGTGILASIERRLDELNTKVDGLPASIRVTDQSSRWRKAMAIGGSVLATLLVTMLTYLLLHLGPAVAH